MTELCPLKVKTVCPNLSGSALPVEPACKECVIYKKTDWIEVKDSMPTGNFSKNTTKYSEEVVVANSCAVEMGHYNRELHQWQTGEPREDKWIDKITHWMPKPKNPHEKY